MLQRLGPPGALPVKPGGAISASSYLGEGRALGVGDGRGETDMIQLAGIVVETEQQRADLAAAGLVAEAADHAVCRAQPLDLEHRALAGEVGAVAPLGDDAVQRAARAVQPALGLLAVRGAGRELQAVGLPRRLVEAFQCRAALDQRVLDQAVAGGVEQHVEQDEDRRRFDGELLDAAFGGVNAHLQRLEGERVANGNRQLAVNDEPARLEAHQHGHDFGKIAPERLARFRPEIDLVARAEGKAAEPIPFRLELPAGLLGELGHELRLHRLDADRYGEGLERGGCHDTCGTRGSA